MENIDEEEKMKKILIIPCAVLIIAFIVMASADDPKGITGICYQDYLHGPTVANCSTMLCFKEYTYECISRADEYGEYTVDLSLPTCNPPGPEAGAYDIKAWKHINNHLYTADNGHEDFDPDGEDLMTNHFVLIGIDK